ncbi:MAG: hypothetical protein ABI056_00575 [Caulobacteraceae bacterium]
MRPLGDGRFCKQEIDTVKNMQRHGLAAAAALLALVANAALAQGAPAQNGPPPPKPKVACAADVQRLCPTATAGRSGTMKCVKAHKSEVSAQCSAAVQYAHQMRAQRRAAKSSQAPPSGSMAPPPPGGMAPPR